MKETSQPCGTFDLRAFGGDVLVSSSGSALLVLFSFIQLLIIPKYLSVEDFGYWQLFMLYASYVGILHLGFINGIHIRWAGKELAQVGNEIKIALRFLLLEQLIVITPLGLLLYFLLQPPFQWIGLMILTYAFILNLVAFFSLTAMAIKKFKLLAIINVSGGLAFLILVVLLFASGFLSYQYVILAFLAASLLALFGFAFWFRQYLWSKTPSQSWQAEGEAILIPKYLGGERRSEKDAQMLAISSLWAYGRENINIGIFALLGGFVVVLFLTIDRLMISSFFAIEQFAIYAFALTAATIAYAFVGAVSGVFFPYLSGISPELRTKAYHLGKPAIILAWAAALTIYFPLTRLIEFYLPYYVASLPIMQILLGAVGFGGLILILHVNYYLVYRKQRQYFLWGIIALALAVTLGLLAIKVFGTLESVAIATLISFSVWYIINELSLRSVVGQSNSELGKGLAILGSYLSTFWLASFLADWFVARMLIYTGFFSLITWVFLRPETRGLVSMAKGLRNWRR